MLALAESRHFFVHMNSRLVAFAKSEEVLERNMPQLQHNMAVVGRDRARARREIHPETGHKIEPSVTIKSSTGSERAHSHSGTRLNCSP